MNTKTTENKNDGRACEKDPELIAAEAGLRVGLERWQEVCPCCFSEAYPGGLPEAIEKLEG